ncbi:MAG: HAD family phosphatase [Bacteroidales bacterium]|nr:HAD family phosphatase [Bacteroidales bacterium]
MTVTTIIFDFGAVLVDWNPHRMLDKYFGSVEKADWFIKNVCTSEWNTEMDGGKPFAQGIAERSAIYPEYAADIQAYYDRWIEMIGGEIPGMREMVAELKEKGYKLYGLTNWSSETFCLVRNEFPVFGLLDGMLVSGEEHLLKPSPEIFQRLVDRFGLTSSECLFIDDNAANVEGSIAFGIPAIRFFGVDSLREDLRERGII